MKKTILTIAAIAFIAVTASTSYGQNIDKKSEKARENIMDAKKDVTDAKQDLNVAQMDSVADYQTFKKETEARILKNEKSLADLKVKISESDVMDKAEYEKNFAAWTQKNVDLKNRLVDYKMNGETKWSSFKKDYSNEMDELEKELKDFSDKHKK